MFQAAIAHLLDVQHTFDVAVFGANAFGPKPQRAFHAKHPSMAGWYAADERTQFISTHAILYSANGRQKCKALFDRAHDVQIDALLSTHANMKKIRLVLQIRKHTATQKIHASKIQHWICPLCELPPMNYRASFLYAGVGLFAVALFAVVGVMVAKRARKVLISYHTPR